MRIRTPLTGLILAGLCPLLAQAPAEKVQFGFTLGAAIPQDTSKMELSSGTLDGNGISQKTSPELGALVDVPLGKGWSTRWGFAYTFESPKFPVDLGDGTLAPRSASRNQWDVFGQALYHFSPSWYGLVGADYVTRTLHADGTDLDTFKKAGFSAGIGWVLRAGRMNIDPEVLYTKVGQEAQYRVRFGFLF
jgi:hypothetical protein